MSSFPWFWTFWHWSTESIRAGVLLRDPIHGIAGHWEEWYRHEATPEERRAIDAIGASPRAQRALVVWLARRWAAETTWRGTRPPVRFVLAQLAALAPFDGWTAFARHRAGRGAATIPAIVLAEESAGEAEDVRALEAMAVPADPDPSAPSVVAEGFHVDEAQLAAARSAALDLLRGRGLLRLVALWTAAGRRPYPRWLGTLLAVGWLAVAGMVVWLVVGPDPGERLVPVAAALTTTWAALALTGAGVAATTAVRAWRDGRRAAARLEGSQVRLRMAGGLTLVGGSAGLPFALGVLLAAYRVVPRSRPRAWLWRRAVRGLGAAAPTWAATGVIDAAGRVRPVVLAPKVRACLRHPHVRALLAPRQPRAGRRVIERLVDALPASRRQRGSAPAAPGARLGFASEARPLRAHRCRHLADAVLAVGGLASPWQLGANVLAVATSAAMLAAAPDLRGILAPPPAPLVVAPFSVTPYQLQVSLDTDRPREFVVVLESDFWSNRRAAVAAVGGGAPPRAELRLSRLTRQRSGDVDDGIVWVERRHRFLTRELVQGERVGRFPLTSLVRLHD